MKNKLRVPIEEVSFRSSSIGLIAGGLIRHGLTENQKAEMQKLEALKLQVVGLSEKQQKELDGFNAKVEAGEKITPTQAEKRDEYTSRLKRLKSLTPTQEAKLQELKEKNAKKPELSQGAKTHIKHVWLQNEKGFHEEISDKKLRKGLQGEEDAINLISFVDRIMYRKNEKRIYKKNNTGECDVYTHFKELPTDNGGFYDVTVIDDTKCSWNPKTFMNADLSVLYQWQGIDYLYLYDADIFRLRHCLVNCPPDVFQDEYKKFCFHNGIIDDTNPEYAEAIKQFIQNYIYDYVSFSQAKRLYPDTVVKLASEMEFNYTEEERVKTFVFERDFDLELILLKSIELAIEYYKTISLNMKG